MDENAEILVATCYNIVTAETIRARERSILVLSKMGETIMQTHKLLRRTVLALALLAVMGAAAADVTVQFVKPDDFIDMPRSERDRDQILKDLTAHFASLGKALPADQDLKITVTDFDLAGRLEPRRWAIDEIRIMRGGADWPHMTVQYTLEQNGQVLRSGTDEVSNMMYQQRMNRYFSNDALRYEKQMIDDWFQKSVVGTQVSRR